MRRSLVWEIMPNELPLYCGARRGGKRSILVCERPPWHQGYPGHAARSKGRWYFWKTKKWERPMARITDRLLVQQAENEIVFVDEGTQNEVAFNVEVIDNVIGALNYFKEMSQDKNE